MSITKTSKDSIQRITEHYGGCGEKGTLAYCWWECKLWILVCKFLKNLKVKLPI
jgi:hypothetical protein